MKLIKLTSTNPYFNLAAEEFFLKNDKDDKLILWQNDNTVVIGRNQNTFAEINVSRAEELGVNIVRRMSGGGAVYHDMGNLNYTFITKSSGDDFLNFKKFTTPVIDALKSIGVTATLSGRNDMLIDGMKFSGNAQYVYKDMLLHHGTLMFSSNVNILSEVLTVNPLKIKTKGISSVRSRVTNIGEYSDISIEKFCSLLFSSAQGEIYELTKSDILEIEKLKNEKYDSWDWNFGYSPKHTFTAEKVFPSGIISVGIEAVGGVISAIKFSGDFFGRKDISELEEFLVGVRHIYEDILKQLENVCITDYIAGVTAEDIAGLLKP